MSALAAQSFPNELRATAPLNRAARPIRLAFLDLSAHLIGAAFLVVVSVGVFLVPSHLTLAIVLLGLAPVVVLLVCHLIAVRMLHPRRTLPRFTPSDFNWSRWQTVHFSSADGLRLEGWFVPPTTQRHGATVIFVHGLGSNRGELLGEAIALARHGYGALLFDLRSHGRSEGRLSTLGYHEVQDIRGAVRFLLSRREVDRKYNGLVGHSIGAVAGLRAAARIPAIRAVVAESAFANLRDNITQGFVAKTGLPPFLLARLAVWIGEHAAGLRVEQLSPLDDLPRIAPRPIMFVHGSQDPVVNVENSVKLHRAARGPKRLVIIPGAGHSRLLDSDPGRFERDLVAFFDQHLQPDETQRILIRRRPNVRLGQLAQSGLTNPSPTTSPYLDLGHLSGRRGDTAPLVQANFLCSQSTRAP